MSGRPEHSLLELLQRLPPTLELLVGSIAVALTVGVAASMVASRTRGSIGRDLGRSLATVLRCIPFFWLAFCLSVLAVLRWGTSVFGWASIDQFSARDHLVHLILPACIVAIAEFPIVWSALEDVRYSHGDWKIDLKTRVSLALRELAWRLPEVFGACLLTEMAFAWPGEGRLFLHALSTSHQAPLLSLVLLIAVITLVVRLVVRIAARRDVQHFETHDA